MVTTHCYGAQFHIAQAASNDYKNSTSKEELKHSQDLTQIIIHKLRYLFMIHDIGKVTRSGGEELRMEKATWGP